MPSTRRRILAFGGSALATLGLAGCIGDGGETDAPGGGEAVDPTTSSAAPDTTTSPATPPMGSPTAAENPTGTGKTADGTTPDGTPSTGPGTPVETPPGAPTDYPYWLPAPSALDREYYPVTSVAAGAVHDLADSLGDGALDSFSGEFPVPGIDTWASVRTVHQVARAATVTRADFDRAAVEAAFRDADAGFAEGTYGGYSLFEAPDAVAAVGQGVVVMSGAFGGSGLADQRSVVEHVVDAEAGRGTRYVDASADFDRLVSAVGPAHLFRARTYPTGSAVFPGAVADAFAYYLGADEVVVRTPVVFESAEVERAAVAEWASGASIFRGRDPDVEVSDRVVAASATVPTGEITTFVRQFPGEGDGGAAEAPQVAFDFTYEETGDDRGLLTVTHHGGDAVDRTGLYLRGDGFATVDGADQTSAGQWQGSASGDGGRVSAGDAVDVGVTSAYEIVVVWESSDGATSATLAQSEGPDA